MKLVYVCGPFRGTTPWDVHCNVHEAEHLGLRVANLGMYPVIPHAMTRNFDKQLIDQFWLDGTLELMRRCDALLTTPAWRKSLGAVLEVEEMIRIGKPVFHDLVQLENWYQFPTTT